MRKWSIVFILFWIGVYFGGYVFLRLNGVLVLNDTVPVFIRVNLSHYIYESKPQLVDYATVIYSPFIALENNFFED